MPQPPVELFISNHLYPVFLDIEALATFLTIDFY